MIETSFKIRDRLNLHKATFQADIFDHWREIRGSGTFPDKRDFRPQRFPKFLPQIAIIAITDHGFEDRLTGDMVIEVLRLRQNHDPLAAPSDPAVRDTVLGILNAAVQARSPMYFKGRFLLANANPVDFSALALPFSHSDTPDRLDTVMLAFDFSKHNALDLPMQEGATA